MITEQLEQCQEWLDNALEILEIMGDKKMSAEKQISHIAAAEDLLRDVKRQIAEWQPTQSVDYTDKFRLNAAEHDKMARDSIIRELMGKNAARNKRIHSVV